MKAVELVSIGQLTLVEKEKPSPKKGEVLLKIMACGICGSDIPRTFVTGSYHFPTVLGHEFSGEIVALGDEVEESYLGRKAAVFPLLPCNQCEFCQSGNYAQCTNYNYFGSRTDGGFEEYLAVPVFNLVLLEDQVSFEEGAMVEPATVAQHVVNKAQVTLGDSIVIFGAGPIGVMVAQWAKINGAGKVLLADIDQTKVDFAKELGFEFVCNSGEVSAEEFIKETLGGKLADIAVEATGSSAAFDQCVQSIRAFGRVVLLGNPHSDMTLKQKTYDQFMRKEGTIVGMFNSVYDKIPKNEWRVTAQAIADGSLNLSPLITHKVPIEELIAAFDMVHEKKEFYNKVLMVHEDLL
ncbi:galactitol-1-phosphate 5-dehydrogenase [Enterococcus pallens]|uniref:Chlorophyll synthesis pathway protein BchC n=1 Tax=Enterococcus pallens ATCC BAA-351 TaxID=1158607 RepID=R2SDR5_9ENTE|nr:galactitol-1-phosphate 5-dehydrogenase [Enterococcus pallens]EOH93670.1 chlorophyll synthesis pathway protein BchC [Enterococcus pallens ATCC BAA-351]EOU24510.1 chlorophyll synthesis pathway protein BchC [Enterococcus pallens ATCC BAA-351]OJG78604.1 chlorophyll synthesis pathway protein BchC [Enterococcus pallens]